MQFFKKVFLLFVVFSVVFFLYSPEEELGFSNNDSDEKSNLITVLSEVKSNNNIYALEHLIRQSEIDMDFYQKIDMSETDFLALKNKVCEENLKKPEHKENAKIICDPTVLAHH